VFHSEMWFEQLVPPNNYLWKPRFRALHLAGRTNSIFSCDIKYNIFFILVAAWKKLHT